MNSDPAFKRINSDQNESNWLGDNVPEFFGYRKIEFSNTPEAQRRRELLAKYFGADQYEKILADRNHLKNIRDSYLGQYEEGGYSDDRELALKESLDYYVLARLSGDDADKFIRSKEFRSYSRYIMNIAESKTIQTPDDMTLYPELSTNPVLRNAATRRLVLKNAYPLRNPQKVGASIRRHMEEYKHEIDTTEKLLEDGYELSQFQIDLVGDYLYSNKDIDTIAVGSLAEEYAGYCFDKITEESPIKPSVPMLGALANYFARLYTADSDVRDGSRVIIANHRDRGIGVSTDYGCVLSPEHFLQMSLVSDNSLDKSRTFRSNDLYFFMVVCFHELTHDHQRAMAKKGEKNSSAMSWVLKKVLDDGPCFEEKREDGTIRKVPYYQANHDNDETEIEADEEAWRQCQKAIDHIRGGYALRHIEEYKRIELKKREQIDKCKSNEAEIHARRAFAKKISSTGETLDSIRYDILGLKTAVKTKPWVLPSFPQLGKYLDKSGELRSEVLFDDKIADTSQDSFDLEVGTFMLTQPEEVNRISNFIYNNGDRLSGEQVEHLMMNLWNIIYQNIAKFKTLEKVNSKNYDETRASGKDFDIEKVRASFSERYLYQCYNAVLISEKLKSMRPELGDLISDGQEQFIGIYYHGFPGINGLDSGFLEEVISRFVKSQHPSLVKVAARMKENMH